MITIRVLSEFVQGDTKIITLQIGINEDVEVKHKKRSKNANAYFWELLQQLCEEMNIDVISEYKNRVKELGIFRQWEIDNKNAPTFIKVWENNGIAWFCEVVEEIEGKCIINAYYGSSSFSSKQMTRLIDNLVQDCRSVGIKTLEDYEIEDLIKREER